MYLPTYPNIVERQAIVTTTLVPTPTTTTSTTSDSLLGKASSATGLAWWQLLCIALGGVAVVVGILIFWWKRRNKKKKKELAKKAAEAEKKQQVTAKSKRVAESDSEESDESDYDSMSDGGTIRPSRRQIARRKARRGGRMDDRGRGRSRRGEKERYMSDSDYYTSDASSITVRDRRRDRRRDHRRYDGGYDRSRIRERDRRRPHTPDYPPRRPRSVTPPPRSRRLPSPSPSPPSGKAPSKDKFRDSVFSTYTSMKKAAVKLKYVEAKVKLKKQLAEEEEIEAKRKDKIREANKEIEDSKRKMDTAEHSSNSLRPLIPPARPRTAHFASDSGSARSTPSLPTPPARATRRQHITRDTPLDREPQHPRAVKPPQRIPGQPVKSAIRLPPPTRNGSADTVVRPNNYPGVRPPRKEQTIPPPASNHPVAPINQFAADWLSHPSIQKPAQTGSVYLPVTPPRDRPRIPPGGLAPAPAPGLKRKPSEPMLPWVGPSIGRQTGVGVAGTPPSAGNKWASRLRERR